MGLFDEILRARGLDDIAKRRAFLHPDYAQRHDPFLLPDMAAAVDRLVAAHEKQEKITIYGDYDIDGLTATTVLLDAFESFGFDQVDAFIPNRFIEGYGLTVEAVEKIAAAGAQLIITVDCGSLSTREIERANELGVDVIVTDHHNVQKVQPPAVAVINPKRLLMEYPDRYRDFVLKSEFVEVFFDAVDSSQEVFSAQSQQSAKLAKAQTFSTGLDSAKKTSGLAKASKNTSTNSSRLYPFLDLPGVGVAFKLVQALQTKLDGLPEGQEKWLLDLVALGTVCDVVTLVDENRLHVYWGLKVLEKTRRPGLRALMAVSGVEPRKVNARSLGFALGPRMNAAGRLETAQHALDMLRAADKDVALEKAQLLDEMNAKRRADQDKIYREAIIEADKYGDDAVLVVSGEGWSHGIIGIVAAKLLEKYHKPTFVLEEMEDGDAKGSARSYGDFSAADAIRAADDIITKGGGHKLAAGVTLPAANIAAFRQRVNEYYRDQGLTLSEQQQHLLPTAEAVADFGDLTEDLIERLSELEPFGNGNAQPILQTSMLVVKNIRRMGNEGQHVKLTLSDAAKTIDFLAFSAPEYFFVEPGERVVVWYTPEINEWQGRRSVEGRLLHIDKI